MHLPEILHIVAEELGVAQAFKLARIYGGQKVYIPSHLKEDSPIVKALGMEIAQVLSDHFGEERIMIPLGGAGTYAKMRANIYKDVKSGEFTNNQIAAKYGICNLTVTRARNRLKEQGMQDDLFSLTDDS